MPQKNLIMISVDDLVNVVKFRDALGIELQTPNIDYLMSRGATFTNAYTPVPLCGPSRTATLTGQSPYSTGVHHNDGLQLSDVVTADDTIFGAAHASGYFTAIRGKMFHGQSSEFVNSFLGETVDTYGGNSGYNGAGNTLLLSTVPNDIPEDEWRDTLTGDWAVNILNTFTEDAPLFLSVGISKPHLGWDVPQEYFDLYNLEDIEFPIVEGTTWDNLPEFFVNFISMAPQAHDEIIKANAWAELIRAYAAAVSYADAQIGKVLQAIDDNSLWNTSTIVLWSDHGYHLGDYDSWNKFTLWEAAASVQFIVADPDVASNTTISTPVSLLDLWPTISGLTGIEGPKTSDGVDLTNLLLYGEEPNRAGVITTAYGSTSIVSGNWRYVLYNDGDEELFNIGGSVHSENLSDKKWAENRLDIMKDLLEKELTDQYGVSIIDGRDHGSIGADQLIVLGNSVARGWRGDDTYFVTETGKVIEKEDGGIDTIVLSAIEKSYKIPENVENLVLIRRAKIGVAIGNDEDNFILGNALDNTIRGGKGDDYIYGAGGDDILYGNIGADTFAFGTNDGRDVVYGFNVNADTLDIRSEIDNIRSVGNGTRIIIGDDVLILRGVSIEDIGDLL